MMLRNKSGQVTIFVIVAIVMVVGIIAAIIFTGRNELISPKEISTEQSVEGCVKDAVENKLALILENGGEITPEKTISYLGEDYNYLCYQADYFLPCYNLKPALEMTIEEILKESTKSEVQSCFDKFRVEEESKGFSVVGGETTYSIDLLPGSVQVLLKKDIRVTDGSSSQEFSNFDFKILSQAYELIDVSRNIVNAESEYCYFEYSGYMLLHPEFNIRKAYSDDSKVYSVEQTRTKERFKFAVRSCAPKPGL